VPRFEFDPSKSESNRRKHGIDFLRAQALWDGLHAVVPARRVSGENRSLIIGMIGGKTFAAVYTLREGTIRLISCHRADVRLERDLRRMLDEEKE
jgi:uncharacterized DUF497 family protein